MEFPIVLNTSTNFEHSLAFQTRPVLTRSYICVLSLASLTGTIGNALVLLSVGLLMRKKHLEIVHGYPFICNLACSDAVVTAIINPFAILGKEEKWEGK